jgi:hypothetical protein
MTDDPGKLPHFIMRGGDELAAALFDSEDSAAADRGELGTKPRFQARRLASPPGPP